MPLVSVVLPCYNSSATIGKAIDSILNQTFTDWELVVVDDASTDDSRQVIDSFNDQRIRKIYLAVNGGYPVAMNEGISISTGKYIARMDADDVSAPSRLEEQLKAINEFPTAALCGTARYKITPSAVSYVSKIAHDEIVREETWDDLMQGRRQFTDGSVMVKRDYVVAVGGYRTYQRSGMDVDLWLRIMEKFGNAVTILRPLYGRRLDLNSLVFNPQTNLSNQIPRVLATQRRTRGSDDVQDNRVFNLETLLAEGLITRRSGSSDALIVGTVATCMRLGDWKGAWSFLTHLFQSRGFSPLSKIRFLFRVGLKYVYRLRHNPHKRIYLK